MEVITSWHFSSVPLSCMIEVFLNAVKWDSSSLWIQIWGIFEPIAFCVWLVTTARNYYTTWPLFEGCTSFCCELCAWQMLFDLWIFFILIFVYSKMKKSCIVHMWWYVVVTVYLLYWLLVTWCCDAQVPDQVSSGRACLAPGGGSTDSQASMSYLHETVGARLAV